MRRGAAVRTGRGHDATAVSTPRSHAPSYVVRSLLGVVAAALVWVVGVAAPTAVADEPAAPSRAVPSQAAYLAAQLRQDPVYVSDQMPREVPRSTRPEFARRAQRTGVPTYVLVLPTQSRAKALLAGVHEELGRDGLYVLVDQHGVAETAAFGVDVPHRAARGAQLYELPYDAGPLACFERFVEVVRLPAPQAEAREEAARGRSEKPRSEYISVTDRRNQSFVTGLTCTGVPLAVLLLGPVVRRHRARVRAAREPVVLPTGRRVPVTSRSARSAARRRREAPPVPSMRPNRWELVAAGVTAAVVLAGATVLFDEERTTAAPTPTAADLDARVQRVADGLTRDRLYVDPESPRPLTAEQLTEVRERLDTTLDGRLRLALVPSLTEDETAGDAERLVHRLHDAVAEDGVYVAADPYNGELTAVSFGVPLDVRPYEVPEEIRRPDYRDDGPDRNLAQRLDALLTFLAELPRGSEPADPSPPSPAPDPAAERSLPPLIGTDFWPGALLVGPLAAGLLTLAVVVTLAFWRGERRDPRRSHAQLEPDRRETGYPAPSTPSLSWLRRTAQAELDRLGRDFDRLVPPEGKRRAWAYDCLDAATLLADQDGDGRLDRDAEPASLAAVIALVRCVRAGLGDSGGHANRRQRTVHRCCGLNPLHGPAVPGQRGAPRCGRCAQLTAASPDAAQRLALTLPAPGGGGRIPYQEAEGPLPAVQQGLAALVREIKENAGVR